MGRGFRLTGCGRPSAGKPCSLPRCPNEWQTGTGRCLYARRRIVCPYRQPNHGNQYLVPVAGTAGAGTGTAAKGCADPFYAGFVCGSIGGRAGLRAQHCVHQPDAGPPHRAVEQRSAGRLRLAGKPLRTHCCQRHSDMYTCKRCENHCGGRA